MADADLENKDLLLTILDGYKQEAQSARAGGENPRDNKWRENTDLYWNRYDFSQKASWQAKVVPPEVPQYVDRFAAAMTEALTKPGRAFTVTNVIDKEDDITKSVAKMMDVWLARCGRSASGDVLGYDAVFEETMKCGAITNAAQVIAPKKDMLTGGLYTSIATVDPRRLWVDHTGRNLYRIHRQELDLNALMREARQKDGKGKSIYDLGAVEELVSTILGTMEDDQRRMTGSGTGQTSYRKPVVLDEYLCTLLSPDGRELMRNALVVVANEKVIVRGPEPNPFWHKYDWIVQTPLVTVPFSPYGRSYMEDFGSLARLYTELTNMIIDAVYTSSLKVFARVPDMLSDPSQLDDGIFPNAVFDIDTGLGATKDFLTPIDMGALSADAVGVWKAIKQALDVAAMSNEFMQGQFAPKGRTSAEEVQTVTEQASGMLRSVARTVETRLVEPVLERVWRTGLQFMSPDDKALQQAVGPRMFQAVYARRREFASEPFVFKVRSISGLIAKNEKLRKLVQTLAIIGRSPHLMQAFMVKYSPDRLLDILFELHDIDTGDLQLSERELMMQALQAMGQAQMGGGVPGQPGQAAPQGPRPLSTPQLGQPGRPAGVR